MKRKEAICLMGMILEMSTYHDRLKPSKAARTSDNGNVTANKIHDIRLKTMEGKQAHTFDECNLLYPSRVVPRCWW